MGSDISSVRGSEGSSGGSILVGVVIAIIGILMLPTVLATMTQDHAWEGSNNVDCTKCHGDVYVPQTEGEMHGSLGKADDPNAYCASCHQGDFELDIDGDSLDDHTVATIECLDCHSGGPSARKGGKDVLMDRTDTGNGRYINSQNSVHRDMFLEDDEDPNDVESYKGKNDVCVACHSNVQISYEERVDMGLAPGKGRLSDGFILEAQQELAGDWTITKFEFASFPSP